MAHPLSDLRIVEVSAFVAAPLGGMTLAQLGADVIRVDAIGGNIDIGRWPLARDGNSLYWASLNKAKRSVTLALNTPQGQDLARALICAPGAGGGNLLTNLPAAGWMTYQALSEVRSDLIMTRLTGTSAGGNAIDYTVNSASGFPLTTGTGDNPVNHVLPAWDVTAALYLSTGFLAAERARRATGQGQEVTLALSDVMLATVSNLGYLADVQINDAVRPPMGNDLYGAFGRDFATADHRRIMLAAISNRQWRAIGKATGLSERLAMIGPMMQVDLDTEGGRFEARHAIAAVLEPWFAQHTLAEIGAAFQGSGVLWGPYQDFRQLLHDDPLCSLANPMFGDIHQPGVGPLMVNTQPLNFAATAGRRPTAAPRLGEHTEAVLTEILGLPSAEYARLHDAGVVAGPKR
ncbi:CoA transferase [Rhodopila sp.]|uniref:CoA transferase n=1 Tax=Rhodopila sp. TaxID=2480087 RepID=UPI003D12B6FF